MLCISPLPHHIERRATGRDRLFHIPGQYSTIQKARVALIMLRKMWRAKQIQINTKLKIFNSHFKAVLLYESEIWQSTHNTLTRIQTFINKCLRRILYLKWTDKVSNTTHRNEIKKSKWKPSETITRHADKWNPPGKRRRGRSRNTWQRDIKWKQNRWITPGEILEKMATDITQWRSLVDGLIPSEQTGINKTNKSDHI